MVAGTKTLKPVHPVLARAQTRRDVLLCTPSHDRQERDMRQGWILAAALLCAASLSAQRTLIVDAKGGSGVYTKFAPAVAAARDGDRILIRAGNYYGTTISKALDIRAHPGVVLSPNLSGFSRLRVTGIGKGKTLVLDGPTIKGALFGSALHPGVDVANCQGRVLIRNVRVDVSSALFNSAPPASIQVRNCAAVSVERATLIGPLVAFTSTVSVASASIQGTDSTGKFGPYTSFASQGVSASSSRLDLANVVLRGGNGHSAFAVSAMEALGAINSHIVIRGDSSRVTAGSKGPKTVAAMYGGKTTTLRIDPDVVVVGKVSDFKRTTRVQMGAMRTTDAKLGKMLQVDLLAPKGQFYDFFLSLPGRPVTHGPWGDFWLDWNTLIPISLGFVPPAGVVSLKLTVPNNPNLRYLNLAFQGKTGPWPNLFYTNPVSVTVR